MKTPSGAFSLVALVAIAIGAILTFGLFAESPTPGTTPADHKYLLQIYGDPLPVKDFDTFVTVLQSVSGMERNAVRWYYEPDHYVAVPPFVNVTPPAKALSAGDRTGVHVTQRVTSDSAADFQKVLNLFAAPTSTPKPTATATAVK